LIPLHMYFDLLSGIIQAFVFMLLTMVYWKLEAKDIPQPVSPTVIAINK
jgi:F0F1-type ATP synthase membrane subunit a